MVRVVIGLSDGSEREYEVPPYAVDQCLRLPREVSRHKYWAVMTGDERLLAGHAMVWWVAEDEG